MAETIEVKKGRYKIIYNREGCIGAEACVIVHPNQWYMSPDNKADFKKEQFDQEELELNVEAAESCPVKVIKIIDTETGKVIFPRED
ncbi:MAG: ferredoxin [Candidatus Woesearchaeota archaeon]|nr:MAG: ferredoxin [Candidatus Woesearchaeota archaeon]